MAKASTPAIPPIEAVLQPADLKVIDLVRSSLGERAAKSTELIILRERAKRVVRMAPEEVEGAIAYAHGDLKGEVGNRNKRRSYFYVLARKFLLEDRSVLAKFESFGRTLLNGEGNGSTEAANDTFPCTRCARVFKTKQALGTHKNRMHGIKSPTRTARLKRRVRTKRREAVINVG